MQLIFIFFIPSYNLPPVAVRKLGFSAVTVQLSSVTVTIYIYIYLKVVLVILNAMKIRIKSMTTSTLY